MANDPKGTPKYLPQINLTAVLTAVYTFQGMVEFVAGTRKRYVRSTLQNF